MIMSNLLPIEWPKKHNLFGVKVSATDYHEVVRSVIAAGLRKQSALVTFLPVHGIVTAAQDAGYRKLINDFEVVAPDGQPVRWALNLFHGAGLEDRVYGPHTMRRICLRAAQSGIPIYLYGSTPDVLKNLNDRLMDWFPTLKIVGMEAPPFRPLTPEENDAACQRINASGAGIVFIGLGCPRQDEFAHANREKIQAVQCCVGAAFDFHAGNKKMAPEFLQRHGLEWLFRLVQEPRRLWKRYFVTNSIFIGLCLASVFRLETQFAKFITPAPEGQGA
jgi:N-acetylglucosaminyldiphosphoundecaprenol N-acetyl-beta-D-mannosaminyltransferase